MRLFFIKNNQLLHCTRKSTQCWKIFTRFVTKMFPHWYGTFVGSCICKNWSTAGSYWYTWEFFEKVSRWSIANDTSGANIGTYGQFTDVSANASAHCAARADQQWSTCLHRCSSFLRQPAGNEFALLSVFEVNQIYMALYFISYFFVQIIINL